MVLSNFTVNMYLTVLLLTLNTNPSKIRNTVVQGSTIGSILVVNPDCP